MPMYAYKAADPNGRLIEDILEAPDAGGVAAHLHEKDCIPIRIRPVEDRRPRLSLKMTLPRLRLPRSVPRRDIMRFTQDLATLLGAGLPVDRALKVIVDSTDNDRFKGIIRELAADVEGGLQLSDALARHPKIFSRLYGNMVRAGETGGALEPVLTRMGAYLEETNDLVDYIRSALIYPAFLVTVGGLSIAILLTYVIPRFSVIFADFEQALPLVTRILLGLSDMLRHYAVLILIGVLVAGIAAWRFLSTPAGRQRWDRLQLRLPVWRQVVQTVETARFARTLGTLIKSGVPIIEALGLTREVSGNTILGATLENLQTRVKNGERLAPCLSENGFFPELAVQMVTVGEETGKLDEMLLRVADSYDKTVRSMTKRLISLLEPALILIMGLVVGFVVIAMLMAIFSINELPF